MNRISISRLALTCVGAFCFLAACGPRMKPVEYEEPSKNLSNGSDVGDDTSSSSASSASSASSSGDEKAADAPAAKGAGPCKDKKCGQTCSECPPGDENCMEILVLKQCNLKGECVPAAVECSSGDKDGKKDKKDAKDKKSK